MPIRPCDCLRRLPHDERRLLSAFRYSTNETFLHCDPALMPHRRAAWASWNYLSDTEGADRRLSVSYWMNRLQPLGSAPNLFVTLNPLRYIRPDRVYGRYTYEHPTFDDGDNARRSASCGRCRGCATPGSAAPILERASMRTDCRRDLRWPKTSAA